MSAPERIWAASVTDNYGEWQTTTDGMPRPTEYVRADLVMARCSSCDGTGDVHRADGEWLGECDCGSEFRHAYDVEANPSKAFRVIQSLRTQALRSSVRTVAPSEHRQTFTIPDSHEAVRDVNGRATGETRPMAPSEVTKLCAAAEDALSGWRYIRQVHGDLSGVGWDRVETALTSALKGDR